MPPKKPSPYTFILKLEGRHPSDVPMAHVGEYVRLFAELIGANNEPAYVDVVTASTGVKAFVPYSHRRTATHRICRARHDLKSRASHSLRLIEALMGEDGYSGAAVNTDDGTSLIRLTPVSAPVLDGAMVYQTGTVDGEVTGILGSDDSMTLHLRDREHRDVRLMIRDLSLAKKILPHWRTGTVRVQVHGDWLRTDKGWLPDKSCVVDGFEALDAAPVGKILKAFANVKDNGWKVLDDPLLAWKELRGIL